ncbi:hypothetical protein K4F52_002010 [Lecanicillium sp. MT-2017a]|nr:hypothetical protein K4F52_002010 [Lecanicillium sp. MT-2017a]
MAAKLLHIMMLLMAILGTCLAAAAGDAQDTAFYKSQRPTDVQQAPPAAAESSPSSSSSQRRRDTNMHGDAELDDGPRPTYTKTPAPWLVPANTKIPVAVSSAASSDTKPSDPGFVLLGAAVGVITLGMSLV